jgi:hypothetical protein
VRQVEMLKELGAKTTKALPSEMIDAAGTEALPPAPGGAEASHPAAHGAEEPAPATAPVEPPSRSAA